MDAVTNGASPVNGCGICEDLSECFIEKNDLSQTILLPLKGAD